MPAQKTRRMVTSGGLELRTDSDEVVVEGHASTFNQAYDMGWYQERVAPGAFTRTLNAHPDVRLLINHEGLPLARTGQGGVGGTLQLSQDDSGLYMRSILDATDPDVQRIVPKMKRGDLNQMSFAFFTVKDTWSEDRSERTLNELKLDGGDVSIVTYPANPNADVQLRRQQIASEDPERLRELYSELTEGRAGKTLSADTTQRLTALLESLAVADENLDGSLADLSDLLGVDNPDVDAVPAAAEQNSSLMSLDEYRRVIALADLKAVLRK